MKSKYKWLNKMQHLLKGEDQYINFKSVVLQKQGQCDRVDVRRLKYILEMYQVELKGNEEKNKKLAVRGAQ